MGGDIFEEYVYNGDDVNTEVLAYNLEFLQLLYTEILLAGNLRRFFASARAGASAGCEEQQVVDEPMLTIEPDVGQDVSVPETEEPETVAVKPAGAVNDDGGVYTVTYLGYESADVSFMKPFGAEQFMLLDQNWLRMLRKNAPDEECWSELQRMFGTTWVDEVTAMALFMDDELVSSLDALLTFLQCGEELILIESFKKFIKDLWSDVNVQSMLNGIVMRDGGRSKMLAAGKIICLKLMWNHVRFVNATVSKCLLDEGVPMSELLTRVPMVARFENRVMDVLYANFGRQNFNAAVCDKLVRRPAYRGEYICDEEGPGAAEELPPPPPYEGVAKDEAIEQYLRKHGVLIAETIGVNVDEWCKSETSMRKHAADCLSDDMIGIANVRAVQQHDEHKGWFFIDVSHMVKFCDHRIAAHRKANGLFITVFNCKDRVSTLAEVRQALLKASAGKDWFKYSLSDRCGQEPGFVAGDLAELIRRVRSKLISRGRSADDRHMCFELRDGDATDCEPMKRLSRLGDVRWVMAMATDAVMHNLRTVLQLTESEYAELMACYNARTSCGDDLVDNAALQMLLLAFDIRSIKPQVPADDMWEKIVFMEFDEVVKQFAESWNEKMYSSGSIGTMSHINHHIKDPIRGDCAVARIYKYSYLGLPLCVDGAGTKQLLTAIELGYTSRWRSIHGAGYESRQSWFKSNGVKRKKCCIQRTFSSGGKTWELHADSAYDRAHPYGVPGVVYTTSVDPSHMVAWSRKNRISKFKCASGD